MKAVEFLSAIFGELEGYLFIGSKTDATSSDVDISKAFKYPENIAQLESYVSMREDEDLFFSPMLYSVPRRKASAVSHSPVLYADTDLFDPAGYLVEPTFNIATSPGRTASIWMLDDEYSVTDVQAASQAIAHTHASKIDGKQVGVDPSGWIATKLLRLPNSINNKYLVEKYAAEGYTEPFSVEVISSTGSVYSLAEVTAIYDAATVVAPQSELTDELPDNLPEPKDVLRRITASVHLSELYSTEPRGTQDWSDTLYRFVCELFRAGFTAEEVLIGAWYASCNKYKRDGRPMSDLWQYDVRKAQADPSNRPMTRVERMAADDTARPKDEGLSKALELILLTEEERGSLTRTFVDDYCDWAVTKTDAPAPYHVAGAFTAMSLILGEWAVAYPQFGELRLGLFFVIMGETTDTRKTTARNMMKRMIRGCQSDEFDYILTSDTTPESLLDSLSDRAHMSSLYDRDEAQQLVADIKGGKGYMRGFFETLNELYDGWAHGRLRKDKATKDAPVNFVQYMMGIRSQLQENLELSDFVSGWGPRNIFVRGESPPRTRENSRLRQGVPGQANQDQALFMVQCKLMDARAFWSERPAANREQPYQMLFEADAWIRQTDLEWDLKEYFKDHPRFAVLKPSLDRLAINVMKVAVLFAMMDHREEVNMHDVVNARYYAAQWVEDLVIVVEGVNETMYRRDLDALEKFIIENDGFVTYAKALRWATTNGTRKKDFLELVEVLQETEVINIVEDAKNKKSLEIIEH